MCVSVPQVDAVVGEEEDESVDQLRLFKPQGHKHSHQLVQTVQCTRKMYACDVDRVLNYGVMQYQVNFFGLGLRMLPVASACPSR